MDDNQDGLPEGSKNDKNYAEVHLLTQEALDGNWEDTVLQKEEETVPHKRGRLSHLLRTLFRQQ